jgi:hypothetical protein
MHSENNRMFKGTISLLNNRLELDLKCDRWSAPLLPHSYTSSVHAPRICRWNHKSSGFQIGSCVIFYETQPRRPRTVHKGDFWIFQHTISRPSPSPLHQSFYFLGVTQNWLVCSKSQTCPELTPLKCGRRFRSRYLRELWVYIRKVQLGAPFLRCKLSLHSSADPIVDLPRPSLRTALTSPTPPTSPWKRPNQLHPFKGR